MGASLAKVVLSAAWAGRLPPQAQLLFAHMAVTAKDTDKPPRYFGGRDDLALCLFGRLAGDDEHDPARKSQYRTVRRMLAAVVDQGGLVVTPGRGGKRSEYEIHPLGQSVQEGVRCPPVTGLTGGRQVPSTGGRQVPSKGGVRCPPQEGVRCPPKEDEESQEDLLEEESLGPGRQSYVVARANLDKRIGVSA